MIDDTTPVLVEQTSTGDREIMLYRTFREHFAGMGWHLIG